MFDQLASFFAGSLAGCLVTRMVRQRPRARLIARPAPAAPTQEQVAKSEAWARQLREIEAIFRHTSHRPASRHGTPRPASPRRNPRALYTHIGGRASAPVLAWHGPGPQVSQASDWTDAEQA